MRDNRLWTILAAVALIVLILLLLGVDDSDSAPSPTPTPTATAEPERPAYWERHGCKSKITRAEYRAKVDHKFWLTHNGSGVWGNFRAADVTEAERKLLTRARECAGGRYKRQRMKAYMQDRRDLHELYAYGDRITPYGPWAIEPYIVECESGGSWTAANPSGAIGPYQLLGKGAPWPAHTSVSAMIRHHEIAYGLWDGGSGRSHWAECL
jgi:hypothetical protein